MKNKLLNTITTLTDVCSELTSKNKWLKTELSLAKVKLGRRDTYIEDLKNNVRLDSNELNDLKFQYKNLSADFDKILSLAQKHSNTKLGKEIINKLSLF